MGDDKVSGTIAMMVYCICSVISFLGRVIETQTQHCFLKYLMISAIDESNVHCIVRSSIGQYTTELPGRLITCSM
jgi:hypothetical protein